MHERKVVFLLMFIETHTLSWKFMVSKCYSVLPKLMHSKEAKKKFHFLLCATTLNGVKTTSL